MKELDPNAGKAEAGAQTQNPLRFINSAARAGKPKPKRLASD